MLHQAKELRVKRAAIAVLISANLAEIHKEETAEVRRQELLAANEKAFADADNLKRSIDQFERQADLDSEINDQRGYLPDNELLSDDPKERKVQVHRAMEAFLRIGYDGLSDDARSIIVPANDAMRSAVQGAMKHLRGMVREGRDLATTTSGAVLPTEYWQDIEESLLAFGGMREVSTVIRTGHGNAFIMPTMDDTGNMADAEVGEATTTSSSTDPTLSSLTLNAYTYRSLEKVSREMLQDLSFDITKWVNSGLSIRLARRLNQRFTTGDGSSKPNGIATATSSAGTMGSGTSVTITDLTTLEHAVDPSQRRKARWMFHDQMLRNLKRMADTTGQPIWQPGVQVRGPDTIYGYPFTVNQDVAQPSTAGGKVIYFGDFSKYIVRDVVGDVAGPVIIRLNELYAAAGQVGFFLFSRHDGDLLDAGTDPVKHMVTGSPQS